MCLGGFFKACLLVLLFLIAIPIAFGGGFAWKYWFYKGTTEFRWLDDGYWILKNREMYFSMDTQFWIGFVLFAFAYFFLIFIIGMGVYVAGLGMYAVFCCPCWFCNRSKKERENENVNQEQTKTTTKKKKTKKKYDLVEF